MLCFFLIFNQNYDRNFIGKINLSTYNIYKIITFISVFFI